MCDVITVVMTTMEATEVIVVEVVMVAVMAGEVIAVEVMAVEVMAVEIMVVAVIVAAVTMDLLRVVEAIEWTGSDLARLTNLTLLLHVWYHYIAPSFTAFCGCRTKKEF
jgi:hypothetical protein